MAKASTLKRTTSTPITAATSSLVRMAVKAKCQRDRFTHQETSVSASRIVRMTRYWDGRCPPNSGGATRPVAAPVNRTWLVITRSVSLKANVAMAK